mgnify:CR=1 FL=1
MIKNTNLNKAKENKNDEFYTQYADIEKEIESYLKANPTIFEDKTVLLPCDDPTVSNFTRYFVNNFEKLGLKKLISTSFANSYLNETNGKVLVLSKADFTNRNIKESKEIQYSLLRGDGDFRSDEITSFRNEADIIITNPPFSIFREFIDWLVKADKSFLIIGNMNAIGYKKVFPLIQKNKVRLGATFNSGGANFLIPQFLLDNGYENATYNAKTRLVKFGNCCWFTTLKHGNSNEPIKLKTMAENLSSNHRLKEKFAYQKYENFDAIEVPFTDAIPSDYDGIMGVPISFLTKYNPEQFEIIGMGMAMLGLSIGIQPYKQDHRKYRREVQKCGAVDGDLYMIVNGVVKVPYRRILIKKKCK